MIRLDCGCSWRSSTYGIQHSDTSGKKRLGIKPQNVVIDLLGWVRHGMCCVWGATLSTATYRRPSRPSLVSHCLLTACDMASGLLFILALPNSKETKSHDDHRLRNESESNPKELGSHVAHLDAQHRLDNTPLSRAGCILRNCLRRMLKHPLSSSQRSALSPRTKLHTTSKFCNER